MKKPGFSILLAVTLSFAAFTLGFFLGRNGNHSKVQLSVPAVTQTFPTEPSTAPEQTTEEQTVPETQAIVFPIDINTATREEFMALPGIGEVLSGRIIAYREENGSFGTVEELMNIAGIGEKRLEAILDLITVGGKS